MNKRKKRTIICIVVSIVLFFAIAYITNGLYQNNKLFEAIENNNPTAAEEAIDRGAWIDTINYTNILLYPILVDTRSDTPLTKASWLGNEEIVRLLVEQGADVNKCSKNPEIPPLYAALSGHSPKRFSVAKYLIECGADIYTPQKRKYNSFEKILNDTFGIEFYRFELGSYVQETVQIKSNDDEQTLAEGYELFCYFMENGTRTDVKPPSYNLQTWAATWGNTNVLKYLIQEGLYGIDDCDSNGYTALISASKSNKKEAVLLLLELGANTNLSDKNGKTALDYAKEAGNEEIVAILAAQ